MKSKKRKTTKKEEIFRNATKHARVLSSDEHYREREKKKKRYREPHHKKSKNTDVVFIGNKPLMVYVTSTLIQLSNLPSVHIKARGLSIGRAVDVAQIVIRKTENAGYTIGDITIGSESLKSQDGRTRNVSTIEIELKQNLEKHEKKNDDKSYAQDSNDLIEKKLKEEYKDDVKTIFENRGFEILFEDENCIFAKKIDTSYTIFCVKEIEKNMSEFVILESTLPTFLKELNKRIEQSRKKKGKNSKHSTDNSHYNDFRLGALTDFGWRAKHRDVLRKESLIKKICVDGIVSTLRTLNNLLKNRYHEDTLDLIQKDIDYVESLSLQNEITKNKTLDKFRKNMNTLKPELEKNYEVPSKMFFIKLTRKKSDIY